MSELFLMKITAISFRSAYQSLPRQSVLRKKCQVKSAVANIKSLAQFQCKYLFPKSPWIIFASLALSLSFHVSSQWKNIKFLLPASHFFHITSTSLVTDCARRKKFFHFPFIITRLAWEKFPQFSALLFLAWYVCTHYSLRGWRVAVVTIVNDEFFSQWFYCNGGWWIM